MEKKIKKCIRNHHSEHYEYTLRVKFSKIDLQNYLFVTVDSTHIILSNVKRFSTHLSFYPRLGDDYSDQFLTKPHPPTKFTAIQIEIAQLAANRSHACHHTQQHPRSTHMWPCFTHVRYASA